MWDHSATGASSSNTLSPHPISPSHSSLRLHFFSRSPHPTSSYPPLSHPHPLPPSLPPPQARQADACLRVARLGVLTAANLCEDLLVTWRARSITHPLTTHPLTTHPRMTHPIITPQHPPSTHYQDTHCQPHTSR